VRATRLGVPHPFDFAHGRLLRGFRKGGRLTAETQIVGVVNIEQSKFDECSAQGVSLNTVPQPPGQLLSPPCAAVP
jgi:hypothetical protein